jgi:hypothetical protein
MSTGSRDPFALKFKGSNKAFAPFASVGEGAAVARLWLCAAPVASHLEAGERVANLAWRLWAIHERTVVDESPRHRRSFKRLAKGVGERLDRDRSRPVHELSSPELPPVSSSGPVRPLEPSASAPSILKTEGTPRGWRPKPMAERCC